MRRTSAAHAGVVFIALSSKRIGNKTVRFCLCSFSNAASTSASTHGLSTELIRVIERRDRSDQGREESSRCPLDSAWISLKAHKCQTHVRRFESSGYRNMFEAARAARIFRHNVSVSKQLVLVGRQSFQSYGPARMQFARANPQLGSQSKAKTVRKSR